MLIIKLRISYWTQFIFLETAKFHFKQSTRQWCKNLNWIELRNREIFWIDQRSRAATNWIELRQFYLIAQLGCCKLDRITTFFLFSSRDVTNLMDWNRIFFLMTAQRECRKFSRICSETWKRKTNFAMKVNESFFYNFAAFCLHAWYTCYKGLYGTSRTKMQGWARDNFLASRQRQHDNVTEPQGPVRDQTKFEKLLGLSV